MAFQPVFVRSANNYDMKEVSDDTGLACQDESLTMQSFAEDADINVLIRKFGVGYKSPEVPLPLPLSEEFSDIFDFQSAMNTIRQAQETFDAMSADTRARFNNDPARFIAFFEDESNRAEGEKLGLLLPRPTEAEISAAKAAEPVSRGDIAALGEAIRAGARPGAGGAGGAG